ncbi:MAG TPA: 16S rRNA (guanine(966)-N(2))-methyltransferase RsmD [Steroidobacteraceae bacterium]|jgi:16S rRNA (guanine966-N2)-methyltransferase
MGATHYDRGRQQRQLRIIAGRWRGRRFRFPEGTIRPTPDRVRETLFNWLQDRIEGAHCLDLYAGSGALGLEALSRGAASVVFVEQQRAAAMTLERLLMEWHALDAQVVCDEARRFLAKRAAEIRPRGFDLVFLDPPYTSGELALAAAALASRGLAPGGRIYIECGPVPEVLPALPPTWLELRKGKAGEVRYHLFAAEH